MKKLEFLILSLIILLALVLRLYKIDRPLADWHSWRQADTAAVSRNFIKEGFNPFIPKFDDMSSQTNGLDNPNRYRFVEFPVYNILIYLVWSFTGVSVTVARLTTVAITLVTTVFIYLVVRRFSAWQTAAIASFLFATIPYNIFYSSTILPGPFMVMCLFMLYYFFIRFIENDKSWFFLSLSIIFANLAILSWPIATFFCLPVVYLALDKYRLGTIKNIKIWLFAILSIMPFIAWRAWMLQFPQGIPNFQFLLNEDNIRFKGAFFRWLIAERLGKLILSACGFALFIIGLVIKPAKEKLFYISLLISCLVYFVVFASGNVRHDYYQVPIIPTLAIFMAIGTRMLFEIKTPVFNKYLGPLVAIFLILFTFAFGFYEIQGFYWINKPQIVKAGQAVDRLLPKDATVIAPYNGDVAFLYQTNRRGYPITDRPLEEFIASGTKYLVSVDMGDAGIQNLAANCKVIEKTSEYLIIEMFKECIGK